jgi:hypothetical protein
MATMHGALDHAAAHGAPIAITPFLQVLAPALCTEIP